MAYSMFERPKLHNARSMKFYPEQYDHHVSFRHKNLPPDFDLSVESYATTKTKATYSIEAQTSSIHKKCPIYVHKLLHQNDGDFIPKNNKKTKSKHKSVLEKLEENYWANWKPDKNNSKTSSPEIEIIKSAPTERRRKIKIHPQTRQNQIKSDFKIHKNASKSQEIQTDEVPPLPPEPEETIKKIEPEEIITEDTDSIKKSSEELVEDKFLNHTDSLILNAKKQKEEKEHFDQPKCIRLYKKPGKIVTKNYVKGGSYPLKSCLKTDSNFTKGRLGRPGSPMIVSSSYSNKHGRTRR